MFICDIREKYDIVYIFEQPCAYFSKQKRSSVWHFFSVTCNLGETFHSTRFWTLLCLIFKTDERSITFLRLSLQDRHFLMFLLYDSSFGRHMPVKFFEHPFAQLYVEKMLIFLPGLSLQGELFCVN
jgi:hypothetical protein